MRGCKLNSLTVFARGQQPAFFLTLIRRTMDEKTLKELIKEMELRVTSFEYNRDLNKEVDAQHGYWDGKRSEAAFIVEKLNWILENGGF